MPDRPFGAAKTSDVGHAPRGRPLGPRSFDAPVVSVEKSPAPPHAPYPVTRPSVDPPAAIFLDTETTGSGPRDAVIELGIVTAGGEALVDTLVAPLAPVTRGARRVHGISEEDLEGAPSFSSVADRVEAVVSEAGSIWAFSAGYDRRMLLQTAILADRPHLSQRLRDGPWKDLQPQATDVLEDTEQVSLTDAARRLGVAIPTEGRHHRALYDARLARRIWTSIHRPD